jgi:hypothetical protein
MVRSRPETSTSERQLVLALAASGRRVSLDELAAWRKDGLLPPLASHGIRAAGRCYYWREPDILAHAEMVHDALQRHGRSDAVTISLWLRGFDVPLPQLRRAWLHRSKRNGPARIRRVPSKAIPSPSTSGLPGLMLSAAACAAASIENPLGSTQTTFAVLQRALAAMGRTSENQGDMGALWRIATTILLMLGSSDVISTASEEELREAQHHLRAALKFLSDFRGNESADSVIDSLGPPIFLFMMTLLRSGQRSTLETAMDRIAAAQLEAAAPCNNSSHARVAEQVALP